MPVAAEAPRLNVRPLPEGILIELTAGRYGEFDAFGLAAEVLAHAEHSEGPLLCLDFARVEHLSAWLLGQLVAVNRRWREAGGRFAVLNPRPEIHEAFVATGLTKLFVIKGRAVRSAAVIRGAGQPALL